MKKKIKYFFLFLFAFVIVKFIMDGIFLAFFDRTHSELVRDFITTL